MNVTTDTVEPPYTSTVAVGETAGSHDYLFVAGFFFTAALLFTITYAAYTYKRSPPSPPPPSISFATTTYDDQYLITLSRGLDDEVLETFPVFVYSDSTIPHNSTSGCSICLVDYKPADILRLLPKCGHLFHVSCIDTWLKDRPTCPVCRNSPMVPVFQNRSI